MIPTSTILTVISIALTIVSVSFAVFMGVINMKRNKTADDKKDATELTTVIVKLENIGSDTKDIKNEMRSIRNEVGELRDRVIVTEQSLKSFHKRVDNFEGRLHDTEQLIVK
jgi:peptidoglycan hydrolase CwlO-like protein